MMTPIMHDSDEWRDVQKSLKSLATDYASIIGRVNNIESKQASQHTENHDDIVVMKTILLGEPGDETNIGIIRKVDALMAYGKATVFWGKVLAGLITILIAYAMWRDAQHATSKASTPFLGKGNSALSLDRHSELSTIPANP